MNEALPRPWPGIWSRAQIRSCPEDFRVDEILGFEPEGEGEHLWVHVEKRGANTAWVAAELARWAGVTERDVGFAGMKDRHAVTRQWFSLHLPGREAPSGLPQSDEFRVLQATRHRRKLQRGVQRGNRFELVLRGVEGWHPEWEEALLRIVRHGVPNYFGRQRFGIDGGNLEAARRLFAGQRMPRAKRGIVLSAARSHAFNLVLSARVEAGCWDRPVPGEVFVLDGSSSIFGPEPITAELEQRCANGDIHPSGPLWGQGALRTESEALAFDAQPELACPDILRGLERAGLRQERRSLRLPVQDFEHARLGASELRLAFTLAAGCYATAVLDALGAFDECAEQRV